MNTLLKLGIGLVGLIVLYGLAAPMVFFVADLVRHPGALRVEMVAARFNESHVKLVVTVYYNGSVELKDVKLTVLERDIYFGDLIKGSEVSKVITLPISALKEIGKEMSVSFSVVGLYPVELKIRSGTQ